MSEPNIMEADFWLKQILGLAEDNRRWIESSGFEFTYLPVMFDESDMEPGLKKIELTPEAGGHFDQE
jgi:hypothetical protein